MTRNHLDNICEIYIFKCKFMVILYQFGNKQMRGTCNQIKFHGGEGIRKDEANEGDLNEKQ